MTNPQGSNAEQGAQGIRRVGATSLTVAGAAAWIAVNIIIVLPGVDVSQEWSTGMTACLGVVFKGGWEFFSPFIPAPPIHPRH